MLATLLVVLFLLAPSSQAQVQVTATCKDYVGLTNHIAGCIRDSLQSAASVFFSDFYPLVSRAISGILTLGVVVFGVMAAFGMIEKLGRDSIMLLFKIALISYFSTNSDVMYSNVMDMMDGTGQAVMNYVPRTGSTGNSGEQFEQITCLQNMTEAQQSASTDKQIRGPWLAMDCMLDSVIGIKIDAKNGVSQTALSDASAYNKKLGNDQGLSRGLLYLFFSSYQSSVMGLMLAVIGLVFIWGIINLIIKALFIYIAGYIGIAVLIMVSPLFIPMALFQVSKSYFDKWVKLIISFALQPIIILVFVTLTITAVDLATFSGTYSVMYRIAGEEARASDFRLNYYLSCWRDKENPGNCLDPQPSPVDLKKHVAVIQKEAVTVGQVKGDTKDPIETASKETNSIVNNLENSKCTKALMDADAELKKKCEQNYPLQLFRDKMNWDLLAEIRNPQVDLQGAENAGQQLSREALSAVIFVAVVVFVMNELLKVVPMVAYDLVGDYGQLPSLGKVGGALPGSSGGGFRKGLSGMSDMVSGRRSP